MTKTGLFTGTFDPVTIGHQNIVDRALPLFDRLIIAVAESELKHTSRTIEQRVEAIQQLYAHDERVKVIAYSDLTIDLAKRDNIGFIVRGVRSVKDYEYEIAQADFNRQFGNVETIFLPADPNLAMISSSLVRELEHFGKDVTRFLPHEKKVDETGNFRK